MNVYELNMYFLALFMCLYFHDKLPIFFKNYFKTNDKVHTYTTRSASIIHITYIKGLKVRQIFPQL